LEQTPRENTGSSQLQPIPAESAPCRELKATAEDFLLPGVALVATLQCLTTHQCESFTGSWQVGEVSCFSWPELGHPQPNFFLLVSFRSSLRLL